MKRAKLVVSTIVPCLVLMFVTGCATSKAPELTDEELMNLLTEEYLVALEAQDIDKMMTFYSDDFSNYEFGDKEGVRNFMEDAKQMGYLDDIEVDLSEKQTTITGNKASGGPVIVTGSFGSVSFFLEGVKEEGGWKLVDLDMQM